MLNALDNYFAARRAAYRKSQKTNATNPYLRTMSITMSDETRQWAINTMNKGA